MTKEGLLGSCFSLIEILDRISFFRVFSLPSLLLEEKLR